MSRRTVLLVPLVTIFLYLGGYAAARSGGWIVHQSNHRHWHPKKRSPEDALGRIEP